LKYINPIPAQQIAIFIQNALIFINSHKNTGNQPPKSAPQPPAASPDDESYYERIKTALHALHGDDAAEKKLRIIDLTTWEKDGKIIQGNPDYRKKTGKALEILCKNLEKLELEEIQLKIKRSDLQTARINLMQQHSETGQRLTGIKLAAQLKGIKS